MGTARYKPYPAYKPSGVEWLGDFPENWETQRSKTIFRKVQRPTREADGIVTAFRDGEVTLRSKRRTEGFTNAAKEIGYQGVRVGDLLVHAMDGFAGAIGISDSDGKCSPVCSVCVPINPDSVHMPYYGYLVRQLAVTDYITSLAKGIRERSTEFRYNEFSALPLAVPSLPEQTKIAAFLDYETGKIDALIDKQEQLIALLEEKRQAVISHAVTKGLNPNAPLRPSGIDWLGNVPAHWEVSQMKYEAKDGTSITYGIVQAGPHIEDGIPYIKTGDMSGDALPTTGYSKTSKSIDDAYKRSKVFAGDIVIAIRATLGKCLLLPAEIDGANLTQGTAKFSPNEKLLNLYALSYLSCTQVQNYIDSVSKGATFREITLDGLRRIPMLRPPFEEQKKIAKFLEGRKSNFTALIDNGKSAITLLKERRTALISAAVTGKIDVRDWQPPQPLSDTDLSTETLQEAIA